MSPYKGFFGSLFDFSFGSLVMPRIVRALYVLSVAVVGFVLVAVVVSGFALGRGVGIAAIVLGPVIALLYLVTTRVVLELFMVLVRIMENTREMAAGARPESERPS